MERSWRDVLKTTNEQLKRAHKVNEEHVRLRVKTKPNQFGQHSIDLLGNWNGTGKSTRRLHVSVDPKGNFEKTFEQAKHEVHELVLKANMELPTKRDSTVQKLIKPRALQTVLKAQMEDAERYLTARSERMHNNERQLQTHLRWLKHCFGYASEQCREMSLMVCAEALLELYEDRSRSVYKDAVGIMKNVLRERLQLPIGLEEEFKPSYRYMPTPRFDIPDDAELRRRLEAIEDSEQQKLVYAVAVYGHRIMQVWDTRWDTYLPKSGRVRYWCSKVKKQATAVPCPFDGFTMDLSDWRPPNFETLHVYGRDHTSHEQRIRANQSSKTSHLIEKLMGVTATDLRHRYCCVSLLSGQHSPSSCANAVGNSVSMISKTYGNEIAEYEYRRGLELEKE